jgi:hypothetical protein
MIWFRSCTQQQPWIGGGKSSILWNTCMYHFSYVPHPRLITAISFHYDAPCSLYITCSVLFIFCHLSVFCVGHFKLWIFELGKREVQLENSP